MFTQKKLTFSDSDYPWTYTCVHETIDGPACQRQLITDSSSESEKVPLKVCILTCGPYGALWPYPTKKVSRYVCLLILL